MVKADKKKLLENTSDFYEIYYDGGQKYIRIDCYFYDEGEDNGEGTSRCVEYRDFEMPLYDFIDNTYDEDWYSAYGASCRQYCTDMTPAEAYESMDEYYNKDVLPLPYSELNMEIKCGFYVNF